MAVPLDPATPKQTVLVSEDLLPNEEARLLSCLNCNKDVFAWSALDLIGVRRTIIEHSLGIDSSMRPRKQKLRKMSNKKTEATKAVVHRLLEAKFYRNQLLTHLARQCRHGAKEEWEMENVYRFHQPQQRLSKGQISFATNRQNC
jgi:hypothetical protein